MRPFPEHSHGAAAMYRTSAAHAIKNAIRCVGCSPYSVSCSERDDCDGSRCFYSVRDLVQDFKLDPITNNHIMSMVDVDYYCEMPEYMSHGVPILLYTFVPNDVSGESDDAMFTIVDDTVTMFVDGGAIYKHKPHQPST